MTTFKKSTYAQPLVLFPDNKEKIKYWLRATEDGVEIKIYSNEINVLDAEAPIETVILWDIIKLSELQKKPGFVDQTLWGRVSLQVLFPARNPEPPYNYIAQTVDESALIDVFSETVTAKPKTFSTLSSTYGRVPYAIFVPDADDVNSWIIRLKIDANHTAGYEIEGPSANLFVDEDLGDITNVIAPISLSSDQATVSTESSITVTVTSEPYINEIFLEQVYGILNKARVKLTNGQGTFNILTDGLQSGEEIRVKAGHKKFTGIASFSKIIS